MYDQRLTRILDRLVSTFLQEFSTSFGKLKASCIGQGCGLTVCCQLSGLRFDLRRVQGRVGDQASRGHYVWFDELVIDVQSEGEKRYGLLEGHQDSRLYIGFLQVSTYLLGVYPFMAPLSFVPSIRNGDKASEAGHLLGAGKVRHRGHVKPIPSWETVSGVSRRQRYTRSEALFRCIQKEHSITCLISRRFARPW